MLVVILPMELEFEVVELHTIFHMKSSTHKHEWLISFLSKVYFFSVVGVMTIKFLVNNYLS